MMSGRFVAATRNTPARPSAPSISVSSWFTTLRAAITNPSQHPAAVRAVHLRQQLVHHAARSSGQLSTAKPSRHPFQAPACLLTWAHKSMMHWNALAVSCNTEVLRLRQTPRRHRISCTEALTGQVARLKSVPTAAGRGAEKQGAQVKRREGCRTARRPGRCPSRGAARALRARRRTAQPALHSRGFSVRVSRGAAPPGGLTKCASRGAARAQRGRRRTAPPARHFRQLGFRGSPHRSEAWEVSEPRRGASASSSSKKSTAGAAARARANSWRTARSLSPTYLFSSSGPCGAAWGEHVHQSRVACFHHPAQPRARAHTAGAPRARSRPRTCSTAQSPTRNMVRSCQLGHRGSGAQHGVVMSFRSWRLGGHLTRLSYGSCHPREHCLTSGSIPDWPVECSTQ